MGKQKKVYKVIQVNAREHVLVSAQTRGDANIPDPNYIGTGMALCGVLTKGETLEEWENKKAQRKVEREKQERKERLEKKKKKERLTNNPFIN